jgi:hypothetical protein
LSPVDIAHVAVPVNDEHDLGPQMAAAGRPSPVTVDLADDVLQVFRKREGRPVELDIDGLLAALLGRGRRLSGLDLRLLARLGFGGGRLPRGRLRKALPTPSASGEMDAECAGRVRPPPLRASRDTSLGAPPPGRTGPGTGPPPPGGGPRSSLSPPNVGSGGRKSRCRAWKVR